MRFWETSNNGKYRQQFHSQYTAARSKFKSQSLDGAFHSMFEMEVLSVENSSNISTNFGLSSELVMRRHHTHSGCNEQGYLAS